MKLVFVVKVHWLFMVQGYIYIYIYIYNKSLLMRRDGSSVMFPLGSRDGGERVLQRQTLSPK